MPRTKAKPAPLKPALSLARSEEWESWMDWGGDASKQEDGQGEQEPRSSESSSRPTSDRTSPATMSLELSPQSSKKRKFSLDDYGEERPDASPAAQPKKVVQDRSHSVVEKRYRENLNQKISDLRECIPNLKRSAQKAAVGETSTQKQNKATVLTEAMAYIRQLEKRNNYLEQMHHHMREQDNAKREWMQTKPVTTGVDERMRQDELKAETEAPDQAGDHETAKGMIPVPEEWRRLRDSGRSGEHYADTVSRDSNDGPTSSISFRGGKYIGRMVFGSLAGMMIVDGVVSPQAPKRMEKRDDRGLSAVPTLHLLPMYRRLVTFVVNAFSPSNLPFSPLINAFLVFSVCGLMLFFYLYYSKPPSRKDSVGQHPHADQNLLSPLEIRQNAWLTSIQTVWVPRRHMLLEMIALVLETAAYLTRQVLGWRCYSFLTGRTEDEEIARVRAWEIALDAQLSGGDPEMSKSRLVLTLWASGTLPKTPARLMLKALHIRVLFWRPSRFHWISRIMHKAARALARQQWNRASRMQNTAEEMQQPGTGSVTSGVEGLPDHLKNLLGEPADNVLSDAIVNRAYNLAWNLPNDDESLDSSSRDVDGNMIDSAMLGPLDKLALWYPGCKNQLER